MSKTMKHTIVCSLFAFTLVLSACGKSRIGAGTGTSSTSSGGGSKSEAAFDPTVSSNLQVSHYNIVRQRLIDVFGLATSSDAITELDANKLSFQIKAYNASYAKQYASVAASACREMSVATADSLFPELTVDHLWQVLTGEKTPDADVKDMEAKILSEAASEPIATKRWGLCFAVLNEPAVIFINFIKTSATTAGGAS